MASTHRSLKLVTSTAVIMLGAAFSIGATFTVTNTASFGAGSLGQAVLSANATPGNDVIVFQTGLTGTINEFFLTITDPVDIQGPGNGQITITGTEILWASTMASPGVRISGLKFNSFGTAIRAFQAPVTLDDCRFENDLDTSNALIAAAVTELHVGNCDFVNNRGGISAVNCTAEVRNSRFTGNSTSGLAPIFCDTSLVVSGCHFSGNTNTGYGGCVIGTGLTTVEDSVFENNSAQFGGALANTGTLTARGCTFRGNSSTARGGVFYNETSGSVPADFTARNCVVENSSSAGSFFGTSGIGGVACNMGGNYHQIRCRIRGASADFGGAVASIDGGVDLIANDVADVRAVLSPGGGLGYTYGGYLYSVDSTNSHTARLVDEQVVRASSAFHNGLLVISGASSCEIVNGTFVDLSANQFLHIGTLGQNSLVANCIFTGVPSQNAQFNLLSAGFGNVVTVSNSLVQNSGGSASWGLSGLVDGGGNLDADPMFVSAASGNYGLRVGSPAAQAGNNAFVPADAFDLDGDSDVSELLPIDVAGFRRIVGPRVDMGAHEAQPLDLLEQLRQHVRALLSGGAILPANGTSLYAKLDAARDAIINGDLTGATDSLTAFINQVRALVRARRLTAAQGDALISEAQALIDALSP